MKTLSHIRHKVLVLSAAIFIAIGVTACGPTHSYWGVDQSYPVGNGHVYYGAHGGDGPNYNKKEHKKMRKQREKYLKKQRKQHEKNLKKQHKQPPKGHHPK